MIDGTDQPAAACWPQATLDTVGHEAPGTFQVTGAGVQAYGAKSVSSWWAGVLVGDGFAPTPLMVEATAPSDRLLLPGSNALSRPRRSLRWTLLVATWADSVLR